MVVIKKLRYKKKLDLIIPLKLQALNLTRNALLKYYCLGLEKKERRRGESVSRDDRI